VQLKTAAPRDNLGDGSSFSPTDLLAASLGSCMVSTMAIVAKREGIPFDRRQFSLEKHMTQAPPRRVDAVPVTIRLPKSLDEARAAAAGARGAQLPRAPQPAPGDPEGRGVHLRIRGQGTACHASEHGRL
jgi:putative redox protein